MPWAIKHVTDSRLDGHREWLEGNARFSVPACVAGCHKVVYKTRAEARRHIRLHHGYMKKGSYLRTNPHGWKMPVAVRCRITVEEI